MQKLKFARQEKKLNQYELAAASGVPRYVIQLCESGVRMPKLTEQCALAEALATTLEELFGKSQSKEIV